MATIKRLAHGWKLFELSWLFAFTAVAVILTVLWKDNLFGFTVTVTGCLCVMLTAKGKPSSYIYGMYNTFGYAWLAWNNHLYGEVAENLLFFVPMNIIGFILWRRKMNEGTVIMKSLGPKKTVVMSVICAACIAAFGFLLSLIPLQNTPYIDAATNVLSFIATFLMIWRYKEQWLLYIALNILSVIMWAARLANGSPDGAMMVLMWGAYLVNAAYGYINWSRGVKAAREAGLA